MGLGDTNGPPNPSQKIRPNVNQQRRILKWTAERKSKKANR